MAGNIDAAAIFGQLKTAKARVDGNYEKPGIYWTRIDKIKLDVTRKGEVFMAIEKTVVKVLDDDQGKGHKCGESITHLLMHKNDYFQGEVKSLLAAIMGMQTDEIEPAHGVQVCGPDQPLTGMVVLMENRAVTTKPKPGTLTPGLFTRVNYRNEITPEVLLKTLTPEEANRFFPNEGLQKLVAYNASKAK